MESIANQFRPRVNESFAFTCDGSNNWLKRAPRRGAEMVRLESRRLKSERTGGREQEHLLLDFDIQRRRGAASMDHSGPARRQQSLSYGNASLNELGCEGLASGLIGGSWPGSLPCNAAHRSRPEPPSFFSSKSNYSSRSSLSSIFKVVGTLQSINISLLYNRVLKQKSNG
ncbi:hypothetical protein AAHA92_19432 [Salvia divinorum]|uniref:Uncharacterized protein n=1 Tax=Salvia divinorum TaxID=28513 RepID=A0ABD1H5B4_SALDI